MVKDTHDVCTFQYSRGYQHRHSLFEVSGNIAERSSQKSLFKQFSDEKASEAIVNEAFEPGA